MKYIIDIPDTDDYKIYSPLNGVELGLPWKIMDKAYTLPTRIKLEPYIESNRKAIENEVWDFVKKIECLTIGETEDCFDVEYEGIPFVANMFSYQEAKARYEAWKKQKDEIHVGDEVENASHKKGIVFNHYISPSNGVKWVRILCMDNDGNSFMTSWEENDVYKTGRHFDDIEILLNKLKDEL